MSSRSILRAFIFATMTLAFASPQTASAQSTGVGADGYTSILWKGTDSSVSLWRVDSTLTVLGAQEAYGPYLGYTPIALTTDTSNYTHLLWRYTDGSISLWTLDNVLGFVQSQVYGPYFGWTAESLSADPSTGGFRLVWQRTDGAVSLWAFDGNFNLSAEQAYGPFNGYEVDSRTRAARKALLSASKMPIATRSVTTVKAREVAGLSMKLHRSMRVASRARHELRR